jgi:DNA mismatch repair protein MutS
LGFGVGLFLSREIYNIIIKNILDTSNNIQQRMINTSRYIQAIKNINNLIINDTKLLLLLPEATNIKLNLEKNNQNKKLLNILNKNTFKADSPSLISHKGNIFASFELIKNLKANFLKNYKLIAKIDSYISITKLFKEHISNENARYCFVTYRENALKPFLKIENFWHPILNPKTVVTNNLELGISNSKILVTGPNAAGKSTILKAITASTLMAQTIGIAPANVMAFTPFTILNTYLNITDTTGDKSLFQAEMDRALKLLQSILNLKEQQFAFFIMDEIFTGTNPEEGSAAAYGIARKLADFDNTLYLLSTHFKDLTNLENDTNHEIINYMVSAIKKSDGSFYYPYDFKEGISYSKIALDLIKNEGFDPDILTYAYQRLSVN